MSQHAFPASNLYEFPAQGEKAQGFDILTLNRNGNGCNIVFVRFIADPLLPNNHITGFPSLFLSCLSFGGVHSLAPSVE